PQPPLPLFPTRRSSDLNFSPRDQAMAANVKWILEQEGPESKIMLWAHNGHVSTAPLGDGESMGAILRKTYGEKMVVCGFSFDQGDRKSTRLNSSHVAIS